MPNTQFIVATDRGIFYKMQQLSPEKMFIEALQGEPVQPVEVVLIAHGWL